MVETWRANAPKRLVTSYDAEKCAESIDKFSVGIPKPLADDGESLGTRV